MLSMTHQEKTVHKQSNTRQTRALLNLDKKNCKIFLRAKQLPIKGLIDNRCHALEAVPEHRAIHKLNAYFFLQKIKSECKYYVINIPGTANLCLFMFEDEKCGSITVRYTYSTGRCLANC